MRNKEYVQEVYRYIHEVPEPAGQELRTSAYLADELEKYGYNVLRKVSGGTGVMGILDSGMSGPVLGIRADMDAMMYEIDGKIECLHSCGHDAHSAMVMSAAREIADRGIKHGKLYIIFQPAEETGAGCMEMIKSGLLGDMTEIIGIHLRPLEEAQLGQAAAALWHNSCAHARIKIKGLSAHGARPHLGISAADAAALCVNAINTIRANPRISHSIKVTQLITGAGAMNVIPDEAIVGIDIRCTQNDEMDIILEKMRSAVKGATAAVGAAFDIDTEYCPGANYSDELIKLNAEAIVDILGEGGLIPDISTPGSEDFHFFSRELNCKSAYIGLGADLTPGLHSKDMKFNTDALYSGAEILLRIIEKRLIN